MGSKLIGRLRRGDWQETALPLDKTRLCDAVDAEMTRVCRLLRIVTDPELPAVGKWTVRDVAAHLASGLPVYTRMLQGAPSPTHTVEELPQYNVELTAANRERSCAALAEELATVHAEFLSVVRGFAGNPEVFWHADIAIPVSSVAAIYLAEALVHGRDIAHATGQPWTMDPAVVTLAIRGLLPVMPHFVDSEQAADVRARFSIRLRGQPDGRAVLAFDGGRLQVNSAAIGKVDCRISADPETFLLVMYGRSGLFDSVLRGRILAWGRRPWLGFKLPSLLRNP